MATETKERVFHTVPTVEVIDNPTLPLPPKGIPKEILFEALCNSLKDSPNVDKTIPFLEKVYKTTYQAFSESTKSFRHGGDETICHSLYVALLLSHLAKIDDPDILAAAITHDGLEDTSMTLTQLSELTNPRVENLTNTVTKVKSTKPADENHSPPSKRLTAQQIRKDTQATRRKILNALNEDFAAIFIKLGDVLHNGLTIDDLPNPKIQEAKQQLALDFYYPLAISLGADPLARIIADTAIRTLRPAQYKTIEGVRRKAYEEKLPITFFENTSSIMSLTEHISFHIQEWLAEQISESKSIHTHSIQIITPSIYDIYQRTNGSTKLTVADTLPILKIVCDSKADRWQWFELLHEKYGLTKSEQAYNPLEDVKQGKPIHKLFTFTFGDITYELPILLTTKELEAKPIDLVSKHAVFLTKNERQFAERQLEALKQAYEIALEESASNQYTEQKFAETVAKGVITVYAPDGAPHNFPAGATIGDFAYKISSDLGNKALYAYILPNEKKQIPLTRKIRAGEVIKIVSGDENNLTPRLYDQVTTKRARQAIARYIKKIENTPKIKELAKQRGINIVSKFYHRYRGKSLDIHIAYGFEEEYSLDLSLVDKYGALDSFLMQIGLVSFNAQVANAYKLWLSKKESHPVISDVFKLIRNLKNYRESRPTLLMQLGDREGVLKLLGTILQNHSLSVLPLRGKADLWGVGAKPASLELVFTEGDLELVQSAVEELNEYFGDTIKTTVIPGKPFLLKK